MDGTPRSLDLCHADNPIAVDLHASLARDFYGVRTITPEPLHRGDTEPLVGFAPETRNLVGPTLLLTLAAHASEDLHNLQMLRLVELALIARAGDREALWASALERGRAIGAMRFTYPAVALTERLLPGSVSRAYLDAARRDAPSRMRRVVDRLTPATAQRLEGLTLEERLMWARGPREIGARLLHMILPASAGGSARRLTGIYVERLFRLVRGRAGLSGRSR